MVGTILVIGKNLIIPFIAALIIWLLINTVANGIQRIPAIGRALPWGICVIFSLAFWGLFGWGIGSIISDNVTSVIDAVPRYQDKLLQLEEKFEALLHLDSVSIAHPVHDSPTKKCR